METIISIATTMAISAFYTTLTAAPVDILVQATLILSTGVFLSIWNFGGASSIRRDGSDPADLVVMNAKVFTSDDANPQSEAVAVNDKRIVYVGDNEGVSDYIGPNTRVINAHGKMLTPGFIDNHCHHLWIGAIRAFMPLLYTAKNVSDVKTIIREFADQHPDYPFIMGVGWMFDYIPGRFPTKEMADDILPDRPLFMMSYGGEAGWLNSLAFERVKKYPDILKQFPLRTDENGNETGIMYKFFAINPFDFFEEEELPDNLSDILFTAMDDAVDEALRSGITTVNDVQLYKRFFPYLLDYIKNGGLDRIRMRGSYYINHIALEDEDGLKEELREWKAFGKGLSTDYVNLGQSVKLYVEGNPGNYSSLLLEPYADKPDEYGETLWSQEEFDRVMEIVDGMGLQACTHANGDGGVRRVINSYEHVRELNGERDARHRVDHCGLIHPDDIKRMADLNLYAAMQPCHFYGDKTVEEVYGEKRMHTRMPWRSLLDAGVNLSFGSDWCAGPMNPIYGIIVAGNRLNYHLNDEWGPNEKLDIAEIIKSYTIGSARALHMDDDIGSIEVGKLGDFVLFDIDLFDLTSWWFLLTHDLEMGGIGDFVKFTVVGGDIVYHQEGDKF
ncbi:MAG: amidohydrolase [bacterium]|nr:amidohydrolase [bacterium]